MFEAEGCFQAKEDKDKPGLLAMLQKVLQLYSATILSKRSYAKKGDLLNFENFAKLLYASIFYKQNLIIVFSLNSDKLIN